MGAEQCSCGTVHSPLVSPLPFAAIAFSIGMADGRAAERKWARYRYILKAIGTVEVVWLARLLGFMQQSLPAADLGGGASPNQDNAIMTLGCDIIIS